MANRNVTVHPTAEGTGDASYLTLAAAIAGELIVEDDLVTAEELLTIEIQGDWNASPDTTAVVVNAFTDSAAYYVNIYTDSANRAGPTWDTTKYILQVENTYAIYLADN